MKRIEKEIMLKEWFEDANSNEICCVIQDINSYCGDWFLPEEMGNSFFRNNFDTYMAAIKAVCNSDCFDITDDFVVFDDDGDLRSMSGDGYEEYMYEFVGKAIAILLDDTEDGDIDINYLEYMPESLLEILKIRTNCINGS